MTVEPALRRVAAPLREQVVAILREDIVSMKLEPGARLVEGALCERFGVSRPVIREALRQLDAESLVETVPNQGTVVTTLTPKDAQDLYELRASLEGLAGKLFAARAEDSQRQRLRAAFDDIEASFDSGELVEQLAGKDVFYGVLLEGAANSMIRVTLLGIHARVQMLRGISMTAPGRLQQSLEELRTITDAAVRGDEEATRLACETHIVNAASVALAALAER